ncbi:MAG TPA: alpha/beta fold hydrolase [Anaeromyxobacteraceae bacterium]|nr:alpha/beta fold hydrolase [Anaeromyxobacteraceae bacterium]
MIPEGRAFETGSASLLVALRRFRQRLDYLRSYLDLDLGGNVVEKHRDFARCPRPVLLLHGFFATRRALEVLERRFRRDGYCVFSLNLGGLARTFNTRGIDELADVVRMKVERLYHRYPGLGPLTVVGHSKGGLIGAYYVKRLGGHRRVRTLVTLGTPHNGTPVAYAALPLGLLARSLWQVTPLSPFIKRLQRGAWPTGVRLVSIYSRRDHLTPHPAALLDTREIPEARNREVSCTHREFLYRSRVYRAALEEIRVAERGAATRVDPGPPALRLAK